MVIDYGQICTEAGMEEISASKFKATCAEVLRKVKRTRRPVRVTKFGEPLAEIQPPSPVRPSKSWLGSMRGTAKIVGDIISPASDESDWEALQN
jgi:prevent-host-death family protein